MMDDPWGLCGRCLVIVNTRANVAARRDGRVVESCPNPTDPRALRRWAEEKLWGDNCVLSVDDMDYAFDPVTTWHGDPVCSAHLVECRLRELRGGKR